MEKKPDAVLLPDGAVLAPTTADDGSWALKRIEVGEDQHAEWVEHLRDRERRNGPSYWKYVIALIVAGWIIAALATSQS